MKIDLGRTAAILKNERFRNPSTRTMIDVKKVNDDRFHVTVDDGARTEHEVTVETSYWKELTGGDVAPDVLVERSFEFLLEREPNTSILPSFDLSTITRYFPEYEDEIRKRV